MATNAEKKSINLWSYALYLLVKATTKKDESKWTHGNTKHPNVTWLS